MRRRWCPGPWLLALALWIAASSTVAQETSCVGCHSDPDLFVGQQLRIVADLAGGVHAAAGLSCQDCHGGNPAPDLAEDVLAAKDEGFAASSYRGVPERSEIPAFCGRCHSDPELMKRFNPDARVDQEERYATSRHGESLASGDPAVATCTDCHGVHGIRRSSERDSPVHPARVAETCGRCHSDAERMAPYRLADGRPLPVDQVARWRHSVHGVALLEKEDLFAPTCNDCHGNHGAAPPDEDSVANVCGRCHGREARLFRASAKYEGLAEHEELFLPDMGEEGCGACHEPPEPQAELGRPQAFSGCVTCHGNHLVARPTIAHLAPLPMTPCALCHEPPPSLAEEVPEPEAKRRRYERQRDALLAAAAGSGLADEALFDHLVDQALVLPAHTGGEGAQPRPEFARLFEKFRIGKTRVAYTDPVSGEEKHHKVFSCRDCHAAEPQLAEEAAGFAAAGEILLRMRELMVLTARAERLLLAGRRGGVEVREAMLELDLAVDRQIDLEVLLHSFSAAAGSELQKQQAEGLEHARAALAGGEAAREELRTRRLGLVVSLVFIVLFLVALGLKIRELSST